MKPQSKQILGHNNYYNAKLHFRHRRVLSVSGINEHGKLSSTTRRRLHFGHCPANDYTLAHTHTHKEHQCISEPETD